MTPKLKSLLREKVSPVTMAAALIAFDAGYTQTYRPTL